MAPAEERRSGSAVLGVLMFWTVLTTLFAWLPLVRIVGRPEGYEWSLAGLSGSGAEGPYWIFFPLTLYALVLLFTAGRGPRLAFYPLLILWHLLVATVTVAGVLDSGSRATVQGQGLHWNLPLWPVAVLGAAFAVVAVGWTVVDLRAGPPPAPVPWSPWNTRRALLSLLLLGIALALFRAGTNYNWVTAAAIVATILHWISLAESFQSAPRGQDDRKPS